MRVIDADGHVEESLDTFGEKYLDPAFRALRRRVTGVDGLAYWVIDEQLFPLRVGPGCHNLGTPTNGNGRLAAHTLGKSNTIGSMEPSDRERCAAAMLQKRTDISASAKESILDRNPARLYGPA